MTTEARAAKSDCGRSADAADMRAVHYVTLGVANPVAYAALRIYRWKADAAQQIAPAAVEGSEED